MNNDIKKVLDFSENLVQKGITATDIGSGANQLQTRQNLSDLVVELKKHEASFYTRVRKVKGSGMAVVYNLQKDIYKTSDNANPFEAFYADGGLPIARTTQYSNLSFEYKAIGYQGSVTGLSQEQGRSFDDLIAREVRNTMVAVARAVDYLSFWSKTTTVTTSGVTPFAGLDELITTNVVDANGASLTKDLFDQAVHKIYINGGYDAEHTVFLSHRNKIALNNIFNDQRIVINQNGRNDLTLGNITNRIETSIGIMEAVPSFFVNPVSPYTPGSNASSSTPLGTTLSTVFILPMKYIELNELLPMTYEPLAKTADLTTFMVKTYIVPVLTAEPYAAKIINVKEV